jgi:hypothetical protein
MKTLVLDESLDISPSIHHFLSARGAEGVFVCSARELEMAEASQGPVELRVINLSPAVTAWEVSRHLKRPARTTLVFYDEQSAAGLEHLAGLPGVQCLDRPGDAAALAAVLERALGRAENGTGAGAPAATRATAVVSDIVGQSPQIREVFAKIEKVAAGSANVCIVGESGTGKELIARAIHYNSDRRDRPLITLDCTAVPEGLVHRRGGEPRRRLLARPHGHPVHRRDQRAADAAAGQAPARDPDAGVREGGGKQAHPDGHPAHHRQQQGPPPGGGGRQLPGGSLLPDRGGDAADAAPA